MANSIINPTALDDAIEGAKSTRADLAKALGAHVQTVGKWARGERRMGADDVASVARVLGLTDAAELALHRWAAAVAPAPKEGATDAP